MISDEELRLKQIDADPCSHCGACLSFCKWDAFEASQPGLRGDPSLCRTCMLCFSICPRAHPWTPQMEVELFGHSRQHPLLGFYVAAYAARAVEKAPQAQDAGVTTALLRFALRQGLVQGVIVTGRDAEWRPRAFLATSEEEVSGAAGSKYTAAPALSVLGEAVERYERLAFVGMPCQVNALRNLQLRKGERYGAERVVLTVGLFCAESFIYGCPHGLRPFVEREMGMPIREVSRFDIKKGNFVAYGVERIENRPLVELKELVWPICPSCQDFTAELADISVGAVGSRPDENTVLLRSPLGQQIWEQAHTLEWMQLGAVRNLGIIERLTQNKQARRAALSAEASRFLFKRSIRGNYKKLSSTSC
ncbi:MAG: Coenzyme F420 hydrogenase/dehydrogenase, beta subunit C-terminal domain [Chloroflexi bacterium]|nr:Coenzyme F420 hydrogenase/dehydrogenase, beta subunit C-terminal domain [Chloroflexota bacterium]MCL5076165.1 Coenzyme F420 hydrogenase/dehydrogenase, beta subunit C-terminal domain [Chloroflexota bacterium]